MRCYLAHDRSSINPRRKPRDNNEILSFEEDKTTVATAKASWKMMEYSAGQPEASVTVTY